jgi:hypothetical protein
MNCTVGINALMQQDGTMPSHLHKLTNFSLSLLSLCLQHIEKMEAADVKAITDQAEPAPPANLVCPITRCLFEDPVIVVETGHTYERRAIEEHFLVNGSTNPLTSKQRRCLATPQAMALLSSLVTPVVPHGMSCLHRHA